MIAKSKKIGTIIQGAYPDKAGNGSSPEPQAAALHKKDREKNTVGKEVELSKIQEVA